MIKSFIVDKTYASMRIDKYLRFNIGKFPQSLIEKSLRNGKVKVNNQINDVAYMQVKDLTKNENEKVFIFNGWTFASDPNITPFDHAVYDIQLTSCNA